ncbi:MULTISPECIES: toxin [Photorhabdus]|uniref:Toxin n=1 Tax=Photorhabdus luminescens subsp. sonorensis TaxID=1173677 RepID=A0A5C4RDY9_PHOLU|nr:MULTISPECIES: toxin [Photorhabdus]MCW7550605.1 toxin [Photorhabdus aballayi]TNH42018.1 toxin [Photorhabdus luminescens subsp. sonorensis]
MEAVFIELPPFERYRHNYLSDEEFRTFQNMLLENPAAGDVIQHTGGLRKVRFTDSRRKKGKRGGIRVIYYWWVSKSQFMLFTIYDKDEMSDLTKEQCESLRKMLEMRKKGA